eukprot:4827858-Prorocentrum_lima.AAC.1
MPGHIQHSLDHLARRRPLHPSVNGLLGSDLRDHALLQPFGHEVPQPIVSGVPPRPGPACQEMMKGVHR